MAESVREPSEGGRSTDEAVHEKEVTPEHFGNSIGLVGTGGLSRWFRGEPTVTSENVAPVRLRWMCPMPDCGGEMHDTGHVWPTVDPGFHHQCDRCEFTAAIHGKKYPQIEYPTT